MRILPEFEPKVRPFFACPFPCDRRLSTAPQNKVTIVSKRHSGNLLAGIQKYGLDTGLRRYDELAVANWGGQLFVLTCTKSLIADRVGLSV